MCLVLPLILSPLFPLFFFCLPLYSRPLFSPLLLVFFLFSPHFLFFTLYCSSLSPFSIVFLLHPHVASLPFSLSLSLPLTFSSPVSPLISSPIFFCFSFSFQHLPLFLSKPILTSPLTFPHLLLSYFSPVPSPRLLLLLLTWHSPLSLHNSLMYTRHLSLSPLIPSSHSPLPSFNNNKHYFCTNEKAEFCVAFLVSR